MARSPQIGTLRAKGFVFRGRTSIRRKRTGKGASRVNWIIKRDWAPEPDPALIVDHVRDVILAAHREAILAGQRADGSGPQEDLGKRALAQSGRRSVYRGNKTGTLADTLTARPIRMSGPKKNAKSVLVGPKLAKSQRGKPIFGTRAASTITVDPTDIARAAVISKEADRGNVYLYTEGAIEKLIDDAVDQAIDVAFVEGGSRPARMGALQARSTIHK
jgi:hypothetical protein